MYYVKLADSVEGCSSRGRLPMMMLLYNYFHIIKLDQSYSGWYGRGTFDDWLAIRMRA